MFSFLPSSTCTYVGEEALSRRGLLHIKHPIEMGIVHDWTDIEHIWRYVFDKIRQSDASYSSSTDCGSGSTEAPLLVTENHQTTTTSRKHLGELLFETFQVPVLSFQNQAYLSYLSTCYADTVTSSANSNTNDKKEHAIVVDIGHERIDILPIHNHRYETNRIGAPMCIGGKQVGESLVHFVRQLPANQDQGWSSSLHSLIANEVMHQHTYIHLTPNDSDVHNVKETYADYELPDGSLLVIPSKACWQAPECIFNPSLIGRSMYGMHEIIYRCMRRYFPDSQINSEEMRRSCYQHVILSGGGSLFPDMGVRLKQELNLLLSNNREDIAGVKDLSIRQYAAWYGGCLLGNITHHSSSVQSKEEEELQGMRSDCMRSLQVDAEQSWITHAEYEEYGSNILLQKCPLVVNA